MPADEKPIATIRKPCTLTVLTFRRLERLKRIGSHGASVPAIMTNFIEAGVRDAIEKGYIRLEDDE